MFTASKSFWPIGRDGYGWEKGRADLPGEWRVKELRPERRHRADGLRAIAEDRQGDIWVGAGDGNLYQFKAGKFTAHRPGDKLGRQPIWSLLPDDDGTLWVGTFRGGLLRFKDGKFTRRCTTENGLPSDVICQILDDGQGSLWLGSHNGIFQVSKTALEAFEQGEIHSLPCVAYGRNDGLPTLECSGNYQPSCWRSRDGRLWFTTVKGVVSIHPEEMPVNRQVLPVVIEDVMVDGKIPISRSNFTFLRFTPGVANPSRQSPIRVSLHRAQLCGAGKCAFSLQTGGLGNGVG